MMMLGNLFDNENTPSRPHNSPVRTTTSTTSAPPPRGSTNLCGLENLGATCYLNSLIQTLLFTPEFRDGLMALDLDPNLEPRNGIKPDKIRKIPLQLQKLLAQLLLYDAATVTTAPLTDSFGWTDQEEIQQQDVQELIRILFSALQKSLVGTPGQELISSLYQGFTVSKVQCGTCEFVSEREESYLDLTVALAQNKTLKSSLFDAYCEPEAMTGNNQYLCPTCQRHTDASKVVKLRHLPPILSFSLLRFLYDPQEHQRFKDESRLEFPLELNMAPFCENNLASEVTVYELLSVIVHRGGAHGGHYYAIINDIDHLGYWDITTSQRNGHNPRYQPPALLLRDILQGQQDSTLTIEQLLDKVYDCIGVPWSKSYKASHGNIIQFLNSQCSYFFMEGHGIKATVTLINDPSEPKSDETSSQVESHEGRQWFVFNDVDVSPANEEDIENFFEGEESAYMLVYRRKSLKRPKEAYSNPRYGVPDAIQQWVESLNVQTDSDRESSHLLWLRILPYSNYTLCQRSLIAADNNVLELELTIDERETLSTLKKRAFSVCELACIPFSDGEPCNLHLVEQLQYNLVVQDCVPDSESLSLEDFKIQNGQAFLAISGEVDFDTADFSSNDFQRDINQIEYEWGDGSWDDNIGPLQHCTVVDNTPTEMAVDTNPDLNMDTNMDNSLDTNIDTDANIEDTNIEDTNIEDTNIDTRLDTNIDTNLEQDAATYINLSLTTQDFTYKITVEADMDVGQLRTAASMELGSKLPFLSNKKFLMRMGEDIYTLKPPLFDHQLLSDIVSEPDCTIYIEPSIHGPIAKNEIWINFFVADRGCAGRQMSLVIDKDAKVAKLLKTITKLAELSTDVKWQICRIGETGEVCYIPSDNSSTLSKQNVVHGSSLVVRRGQTARTTTVVKLHWLEYADNLSTPCPSKAPSSKNYTCMHVNVDSTLFNLKTTLLDNLEYTYEKNLTEGYLRLRLIAHNRPSVILRDNNMTFGQFKKSINLCFEVLKNEENLRPQQIVLQLWKHIPDTLQYDGPNELLWDTESQSLADAISDYTGIDICNLVVAHYKPGDREWQAIRINSDVKMATDNEKENYNVHSLRDGDIIGVKNAILENANVDDFTTNNDLKRWIAKQEDRDRRGNLSWTSSPVQTRLSERGIHIHVGEF